MKQLLFTILLSMTSILVFSQDYQTIKTYQTSYYDYSYINSLSTVPYTKSNLIVHPNGDTVNDILRIFTYDLVDSFHPALSCHEMVDTNLFGLQNIIEASSRELFFNKNQDTIYLETQSLINESWTMYTDQQIQVIATVDSVAIDSILGITDSIKFISLQVLDSAGNSISHILNNEQIQISKNYGFKRTLPFFYFPDIQGHLDIVGHSKLSSGLHNITRKEIYNFDVGDKFHYLNTYHEDNGFSTYGYTVHIEHVILSKTITSTEAIYSVHEKTFRDEDGFLTYSDEIKNISYPISGSSLDYEPYQTYGMFHNFNMLEYGCNNRIAKRINNSFYDDGTCWTYNNNYPFTTHKYVEGLGKVYFSYYEGLSIVIDERHELTYYYKNGETCGTPFDPNIFYPVSNREVISEELKIFPNPAKDLLTIQSTDNLNFNTTNSILFFNQLGQSFDINHRILDNKIEFDVKHLPSGIYTIMVSNQDNLQLNGRFLKK